MLCYCLSKLNVSKVETTETTARISRFYIKNNEFWIRVFVNTHPQMNLDSSNLQNKIQFMTLATVTVLLKLNCRVQKA
jgi:hypothetical protein